jgi:hypothetical protein
VPGKDAVSCASTEVRAVGKVADGCFSVEELVAELHRLLALVEREGGAGAVDAARAALRKVGGRR